MGMQLCERLDKIVEGKSFYILYLVGVYRGGYDVLVRVKLVLFNNGVIMQLIVRFFDFDVFEVLVIVIG